MSHAVGQCEAFAFTQIQYHRQASNRMMKGSGALSTHRAGAFPVSNRPPTAPKALMVPHNHTLTTHGGPKGMMIKCAIVLKASIIKKSSVKEK